MPSDMPGSGVEVGDRVVCACWMAALEWFRQFSHRRSGSIAHFDKEQVLWAQVFCLPWYAEQQSLHNCILRVEGVSTSSLPNSSHDVRTLDDPWIYCLFVC